MRIESWSPISSSTPGAQTATRSARSPTFRSCAAELRLRPTEPLLGRRTAVFTAGPAPVDDLDAEVVHVSRNLARRDALREELERVEAEVYLVELKAAAVDVVAETALARGAEVVLAANDIVSDELDERILALVPDRSRA